MNEPPASVEYEPSEQIDPAFAQLYDRIEELEAELAQHQWHRVEDELPTKDDVYLTMFSTGAYWLADHADEGWEVANHVVTHWMPLPSPPVVAQI